MSYVTGEQPHNQLSHEFHGRNADTEIGVRAFLGATVLLSVVATAALHTAYQVEGLGHGWRVPITDVHHLVHEGPVNSEVSIDQIPSTRTVTSPHAGPAKTISGLTIKFSKGQYAAEFSKDPAADSIDSAAVDKLEVVVSELAQNKWDNITLTLIGKSSGEDESTDPYRGLTKPSIPNIKLALKRAQELKQFIGTDRKITDAGVSITVGKPEEVNLTSDEIQSVLTAANHSGFKTVGELVDYWNAGGKVSAQNQQVLKQYLGDNRGVDVRITGNQIQPGTITYTKESQPICIVPVTEVIDRIERLQPYKGTLPYPVIIPAILPIYRRRKHGDRIYGTQYEPLPTPKSPEVAAIYARAGYVEVNGVFVPAPGTAAAEIPTQSAQESVENTVEEANLGTAEFSTENIPESSVSHREKWPFSKKWLLLPVAFLAGSVGLGLGVDSCGLGKPNSKPPVAMPVPPNPCAGLPLVQQIQSRRIDTIVNGRVIRSETMPVPVAPVK
jgi:hypothetical protein